MCIFRQRKTLVSIYWYSTTWTVVIENTRPTVCCPHLYEKSSFFNKFLMMEKSLSTKQTLQKYPNLHLEYKYTNLISMRKQRTACHYTSPKQYARCQRCWGTKIIKSICYDSVETNDNSFSWEEQTNIPTGNQILRSLFHLNLATPTEINWLCLKMRQV